MDKKPGEKEKKVLTDKTMKLTGALLMPWSYRTKGTGFVTDVSQETTSLPDRRYSVT